MKQLTFPIILEYCGGQTTDALYEKLAQWNPGYKINVLDNCSPGNKSKYITHQNKANTYVGGGIKDCINLAKQHNCKYLFFVVNDLEIVNCLDIRYLENLMEKDHTVVQAGISVTDDSDKARYYEWMANKGKDKDRVVRHCDLLCCMIRLDFIDEFGGFLDSKSGWGYDWELAHQAKLRNKKIVISDKFLCRHKAETDKWADASALLSKKRKKKELVKTYNERYGDYRLIRPLSRRRMIRFNDLKVGQRVKVKGKPGEDGAFLASEISTKAPADQAVIQGLIQRIDHQKNTLRLFNREFVLPDGVAIKDSQRQILGLKDLKAGDMVQLKGRYSESEGFVPEKIKLQEASDFDLAELQGDINKIDREKKTLVVVGFTVTVSDDTKIS